MTRRTRIPVSATPLGLPEAPLAALGWPAAFARIDAANHSSRWLRAPEKAPTLAEAMLLGDAAESAIHLARDLRSGEARGDEGTRYQAALVVADGVLAAGLQWLAHEGFGCSFLDGHRLGDLEDALERARPRLRETLVVVAHPVGDDAATRHALDAVTGTLRTAGLEDRARWIAFAPPRSPLWEAATRWLGRFALPAWPGADALACGAAGAFLAELGGVDAVDLLRAARDVDEWTEDPEWAHNPAAWIAGLLARGPVGWVADRQALEPFGRWAELAAASAGFALWRGDPAVASPHPRLVLCGAETPGWVTGPALVLRVRIWEPRARGALMALFERAFELAAALS